MRLLPFVVVVFLAGCATHRVGLVHAGDGPVQLESMDGKTVRLLAIGDAAPIAHLDTYIVEVWGQRSFGTMRVSKWRVDSGLHGLTTWVGTLRRHGAQIGLDDRNSGAFYLVSEASEADLTPHLGKPILLEGYVDGPHRVEVLFYHVLTHVDESATEG